MKYPNILHFTNHQIPYFFLGFPVWGSIFLESHFYVLPFYSKIIFLEFKLVFSLDQVPEKHRDNVAAGEACDTDSIPIVVDSDAWVDSAGGRGTVDTVEDSTEVADASAAVSGSSVDSMSEAVVAGRVCCYYCSS